MIVLDSCAAVETLRDTEAAETLRGVLQGDEKVISCDLLRAELASVMRKLVRLKAIDATGAEERFNAALGLVDEFYSLEELQGEALAESIRLDHSVYDVFYFVLARRTRATLLSTDQQLLGLCERNGVNCMTLIEY